MACHTASNAHPTRIRPGPTLLGQHEGRWSAPRARACRAPPPAARRRVGRRSGTFCRPCSLHFGLHTSFAHSTAYTPHTRHGFTHRDTESVPHTEQSPSGPSQPPPVANLSSLYPPRTHVKSILAPPARAAHTLLGAALGARRLRMARCAYTMCARRRTLGLVLGGGRPAARRAARGLGLGDGAEEQPAGRGGARDASIGAELAWLGYGWGWGWG